MYIGTWQVVLILARCLPGTPLSVILAMDVETGVDLLIASAAMQKEAEADAATPRTPTPGGAKTTMIGPDGRRIERTTGGLDVLRGMLKR